MVTAMTDLVSLFRNFVYRDLAFILGGSIVVVSILHAFDISLHRLQDQPYTLFLLTVLAYVVGYTIQELVALLPWRPTFTGYVLRPGRLSLFLYWRFTCLGWQPLTFARSGEEVLRFVNTHEQARHSRTHFEGAGKDTFAESIQYVCWRMFDPGRINLVSQGDFQPVRRHRLDSRYSLADIWHSISLLGLGEGVARNAVL